MSLPLRLAELGSPVGPGREHDITCTRTHGLVTAQNRIATTLTDLGYENAGDGFRHPVMKAWAAN